MIENQHKESSLPRYNEIKKLVDDLVAEIEAQAPFANISELNAAANNIKDILEQYKTAENDRDEEAVAPRYWVPSGIPEHLQIALSIRGEQPESPADHFNSLRGLLTRLAHEWEEDCGKGSVLEAARDYAPDANLRYAASDAGPDAVMAMLMESDHLQLGWVHQIESGSHDEGLQSACHEWGFVDRLSALVRLP